jgi:ABC-2 type transport system ATP-binding protein
LEITNLNKSFKEFTLKNVNFHLPEGYIMGLIGPNGSGKTTTIKLILNMLLKDSGTIKLFGYDHIQKEEEIKEKIGVVFDRAYYQPHWTLMELEKSIRIFYKTWDSKKYLNYLGEFGLKPNSRIKNLSNGMKLKLMIAIALSHDTRFLILDEPTSGLDALSREELLMILHNYVLEEDKSVLFSSHITGDIEKIADYVTFMNEGEIVYTGTRDELLEHYCIIKGDSKELSLEQRNAITGFVEYPTGFEGLYPVQKLKGLSPNIVTDPVTLDDIIIFTTRNSKQQIRAVEKAVV